MFNFDKVNSEVNIDEFLFDPNRFPCNCSISPYATKYFGHIVTRDLLLIKNNKLGKIFCKKVKYREPTSTNSHDAKTNVLSSIDEWIENVLKGKT